MQLVLKTPPAIEPVTLAQLKEHLRLDAGGTFADAIASAQSIFPGLHGIHELMTLDVAPGGAGWAVGDTITGQTSARTCVIVAVLTNKTYYVRDRSGAYTLGEILSNGVATADQGAANPTFGTGYYLIGTGVDVLGKDALVTLVSGTNGATGTVDCKIQESDDNMTFTDWTGGAFTQVTTANDNATYEKQYTGTKQYIRTVAKVLNAACEFGTNSITGSAETTEDDLLNGLIVAARHYVEEKVTWRKLITQSWYMYLDAFPKANYIKIPFGNLTAVTAISYKDTDGASSTMTVTTDYLVETNGDQCGRIVLPYGESWPSETLYPSNPITIDFTCGYGATAASVPQMMRTAIKMVAADLWKLREAHTDWQTYENKWIEGLLERLWI